MTKNQLKEICDSVSSELSEECKGDKLKEKLSLYADSTGQISTVAQMAFCLDEMENFNKQFIYKVLCEALDLKD